MCVCRTLLTFIPKVTRNEGADAIDTVLNAVSKSKDFKLQEQVCHIYVMSSCHVM